MMFSYNDLKDKLPTKVRLGDNTPKYSSRIDVQTTLAKALSKPGAYNGNLTLNNTTQGFGRSN